MSRKISIGALFLLVSACLFHGVDAYAISWKYDLPAALQEAKTSGKPVMVDFYTEWCGWCKKLDIDTYGNSGVQKLAESFICVKIDADKQPGVDALYGVSGYPTILFFSPEGTVMEKFVGYKGPAAFTQTMSAILSKTKKTAGGFMVTDETPAAKKGIRPKSVGSDFVYNGYVEISGEELTAQINYGGNTYFVQQGDNIKDYKVISVDKRRAILEGKDGRVVMEFKKPVDRGGVFDKITSRIEMTKDGEERIFTREEMVFTGPGSASPEEIAAFLVVSGIALVAFAIIYIYFSLCIYFIARKTQTAHAWLGWIPIAQIFLMCAIGRIRYWWVLTLFIPFVNIVTALFMWYKIIAVRGKPGWLLILLLVPLVNYVVMGYLAFSK